MKRRKIKRKSLKCLKKKEQRSGMLTISCKYCVCLNTVCKCTILARHLKHTLTYAVPSTIQIMYNFKQTNRKAHLYIKIAGK